MTKFKKVVLLFLLVSGLVMPVDNFADSIKSWKSCKDTLNELKSGDQCEVKIDQLHPTQFAIGLRMVQTKADKLNALSKDKFKKYLDEHPIPVVIGPQNRLYPTDHHHLGRALLSIGKEKAILEVKENWSFSNDAQFWKQMKASRYVYLYDEKGRGPLSEKQLPQQITDMKDDPYRSLSAEARENDCFEKSTQPFAEFEWAQFFRTRVTILSNNDRDFETSLEKAMHFCHSAEASRLPGFIK